MELQPWTTLESQSVLHDRWINVLSEKCRTAEGVEVTPYYVLQYPDWVQVVAFTPEGRVILTRQFRQGMRAFSIELPGGAMHSGETPVEAATRELAEETGYAGEQAELLASNWVNAATHRNSVHTIVVRNASRVATSHSDPAEMVHAFELPWKDAVGMVLSGEMQSAMQVTSVLLAQHLVQPQL